MADGSVVIQAILDTANVPKQIGNLKSAISDVSWDDITKGTDSAKAVSSAFKSAGASCTAMFTAPIVAAGTGMTKMAWDFEDAMAKVSTIADTTEVPLDELKEQILSLSDETGIAAGDIADNVYNAISAGQETGDAVAFVGQAAKLATAGFTDSASALDVMSTVMNAYKLDAEDTTRVTDVLIQTQNKGKTTVGELSASMGKAIPTASAFNVNLENLAAAYATTTANGIATAESTTYLNSMIKELGNSGSTVGGIVQDKLGMSFADAMASGMSLGDVLNALNEHSAETGQTMYDLFGSAEAASAAATLASGDAAQFSENLAAMNDSAGLTEEGYEKMQTATFDLNKAMNQLKNIMIDIGGTIAEAIAPAVDNFVGKVQAFSDWFKSIGPEGQRVILAIAGVVAAIGPLLTIVGHAISLVPQIQSGLTAISGLMSGAAGGTGALGGALGALAGPAGIVLAVITALAAAFAYLWNTDEGFRNSVMDAWSQIQQAISQAIEQAMPYIQEIADFLANEVMPVVSQVMQFVIQVLAKILSIVASVMPNIVSTISGALTFIKGLFDTVVGFIVGLVTGDFSQMESGIAGIMDGIAGIMDGIWGTITGLVSGAVDAIGNALGFPGLGEKVRGIFDGIKSFLTNPIETARNAIGSAIDAIKGFFSFNIQWPHIPMPHFEVSPAGWEIGDLLKGSIPTLGINWYATGGIFASPQVIGVGDNKRSPEAVTPIDELQGYIKDAVGEKQGGDVYYFGDFVVPEGSKLHRLLEEAAAEAKVRTRMKGRAESYG